MRNNGIQKEGNRKERDILLVIDRNGVILNTFKNHLIDEYNEDYVAAERHYQRIYQRLLVSLAKNEDVLEIEDGLRVLYSQTYRKMNKKNKK